MFTLESSSETALKEASGSLKVKIGKFGSGGGSFSHSSESTDSKVSTIIQIKAFGLGLNLEGSDSLVARDINDYFKAIEFAFKSMQQPEVTICFVLFIADTKFYIMVSIYYS